MNLTDLRNHLFNRPRRQIASPAIHPRANTLALLSPPARAPFLQNQISQGHPPVQVHRLASLPRFSPNRTRYRTDHRLHTAAGHSTRAHSAHHALHRPAVTPQIVPLKLTRLFSHQIEPLSLENTQHLSLRSVLLKTSLIKRSLNRYTPRPAHLFHRCNQRRSLVPASGEGQTHRSYALQGFRPTPLLLHLTPASRPRSTLASPQNLRLCTRKITKNLAVYADPITPFGNHHPGQLLAAPPANLLSQNPHRLSDIPLALAVDTPVFPVISSRAATTEQTLFVIQKQPLFQLNKIHQLLRQTIPRPRYLPHLPGFPIVIQLAPDPLLVKPSLPTPLHLIIYVVPPIPGKTGLIPQNPKTHPLISPIPLWPYAPVKMQVLPHLGTVPSTPPPGSPRWKLSRKTLPTSFHHTLAHRRVAPPGSRKHPQLLLIAHPAHRLTTKSSQLIFLQGSVGGKKFCIQIDKGGRFLTAIACTENRLNDRASPLAGSFYLVLVPGTPHPSVVPDRRLNLLAHSAVVTRLKIIQDFFQHVHPPLWV